MRPVRSILLSAVLVSMLPIAVACGKKGPPLPPFDATTAAQKVRLAEDAWNTREPKRVALAYTADSVWRNRSEFLRDALPSSSSSCANGIASSITA